MNQLKHRFLKAMLARLVALRRALSAFERPLGLALLMLVVLVAAGGVMAQTTAFTYQGKLADNGNPANGPYDFQFKLFDTGTVGTGAQQGSTLAVPNVQVAAGVFILQLDFGAAAFPGAERFLEITVKKASDPTFTTLGPRQPVAANPYAIHALNADGVSVACVNCITSSQIQSVQGAQVTGAIAGSQINGLIPVASVPSGSANYIQNTTSVQAVSNFNISGDGTAGGTLSGNVVNAATQYNLGGLRILSTPGTQNLFAGQNAGLSNTGIGNAFFGFQAGASNTTGFDSAFFGFQAGASNTTGSGNAFFGAQAGAANTTGGGNAFFGVVAGQSNTTGFGNTIIGLGADVAVGNLNNATAIGERAQVSQSNSLVLGAISGVNGGTDTNVGIGTTAPTFRLHVVDPGAAGLRVQTNSTGGAVASFGGFGDFQIDAVNVTGGRFLVKENGRVGIGMTSPDQLLSVNGNASKVGGGSWATFSDERLKTIKGRFTAGLDAVMQLQPIRYEYKPDNALGLRASGEQIGFSAQAVQQIIPEAVSKNNQGYLLVNNDPILWVMLNAIKQQQQQIDTLKKLVCADHLEAAACKSN